MPNRKTLQARCPCCGRDYRAGAILGATQEARIATCFQQGFVRSGEGKNLDSDPLGHKLLRRFVLRAQKFLDSLPE